MNVTWILFGCSVILLPGMALLALRWAMRQGEFSHFEKTALSIFDETEPVGQVSDRFPGPTSQAPIPRRTASLGAADRTCPQP